MGSVRSLTFISRIVSAVPATDQNQTHRHVGAHSHEPYSKFDDSSNGHLNRTSSLRGRCAESEAECLRDSLEADECSGGRRVLDGRKCERREGVVGERVWSERGSQYVSQLRARNEPSAKTSEVTALTRTSILPVRASIPFCHASRSPSRPLGARR